MSAIAKSRPSGSITIPRLGVNVVNSYAAILGLAPVTTDNKVDFPTEGNPINPTSASIFNSNSK